MSIESFAVLLGLTEDLGGRNLMKIVALTCFVGWGMKITAMMALCTGSIAGVISAILFATGFTGCGMLICEHVDSVRKANMKALADKKAELAAEAEMAPVEQVAETADEASKAADAADVRVIALDTVPSEKIIAKVGEKLYKVSFDEIEVEECVR